jgi:hypothetical protein
MRFLSPGFLFALLTIAIPVIIHLFNFRKFKKVYFSNVRFLRNVQIQTSSRQHLKDRLILVVRILGLTFLVLAFSRPYIPGPLQNYGSQNQVLSIFIDNSFSMETLNKEGTLLDEAKRRAKEIASAYSLNDKFQLLTNDFEGRYQRLLNLEEFQNAVDEVEIGASRRNLRQIISRQNDVFLKEPNSPKTIYIISDFQNNLLSSEPVPTDSSTAIRLVRLKSNPQPNVSVDSLWFSSAIHKPDDPEQLIVRLKNNSDEEAINIPIKLFINKEQKALGSLTVKARSSATDTLSFSGLKGGWQDAELEITDYPVVFDDKFYFSFNVQQVLPVLVVNGGAENEYLNSVFRSNPFFSLNNSSSGSLNYSGLDSYPLIILNELPDISEGLSQQLQAYCKRGGNIMVFPDLSNDQSALKKFLQSLGTDLPLEVLTSENRVSVINLQHPIYKGVFENVPQKMDLPVVKKYLRYSSLNNTKRQNLLELPGNLTFLSEYGFGNGKIYLSAVPLKTESSNFARHSIFVPIMYQAALLSIRSQNLFYQLNSEQMIEFPKITLNPNQNLKLRKDKFEAIPDLRQNGNLSQIYIADQIKQVGNYQLLKNDSLLSILSFNDAGSESDMSYASNKELRNNFLGKRIDLLDPEVGSMVSIIKSVNQGSSLWKVCLILALLFFAAEILLIRFYNKLQLKPLNN